MFSRRSFLKRAGAIAGAVAGISAADQSVAGPAPVAPVAAANAQPRITIQSIAAFPRSASPGDLFWDTSRMRLARYVTLQASEYIPLGALVTIPATGTARQARSHEIVDGIAITSAIAGDDVTIQVR